MSNFEVGDRVVVIGVTDTMDNLVGKRGTLKAIMNASAYEYPLEVDLEGWEGALFKAEELELEGVYDALSAPHSDEESSFFDSKVDTCGDADMVVSPPHYTSHPSGVECIQVTEHMDFLTGNIFKYLWRMNSKHETPIEDLKKAKFYLDRLISREEARVGLE
ncbi:DUF3310 domain-containing protein [Streptomyces niveus]|uniref:DUF3310 domain-containing protein n=1 Tax=Streptomyces niveus TaxID=193462 RepID=UPI003405EC1F